MLIALILACSRAPDPTILEVEARLAERVPTIPVIAYTVPDGTVSWVEYGASPDQLDARTPSVADADADVRIMGAKAGYTLYFRVVGIAPAGPVTSPVHAIDVPPPPAGLEGEVSDAVPARQAPGRFLLTMVTPPDLPSHAVIYDRDGDVVWYVAAPRGTSAHTARITADRRSIAYGYYAQTQDDELGGIYRVALDGESDDVVTHTRLAHHDFRELPDGTWMYLGLDLREDQLVEGEVVNVVTDRIFEIGDAAPLGTEPVERFNWFDDLGIPLWWVCDDMVAGSVIPTFHEWTHGNSLLLDPVEPDRYVWVLTRFHDAFVKVDLETRQRVAQIGGIHATIPQVGGAWSHPHLSHSWDGGFVLFNNNTHAEGPSSAQEWAFDGDVATLVREWPGDEAMNGIADARKLSNGNVLISWVNLGFVEERTEDGARVWRLDVPESATGRLTLLDDLYALEADAYAP